MSYGYKDSELYQNYNKKREPTVEELHEMLLNMKFGVEDLYVDEIFANEAVISKIQSDIVLTTELRAEHIKVGSLSEFSDDLGTIETGILKTVVLEGATGTFSGEVSGGVIYANGLDKEFLYTVAIDINPRNPLAVHLYARPKPTGSLRVTATRTLDDWRPVEAGGFENRSQSAIKEDIELWQESALDIISSSEIYQYRLCSDVRNGIDKLKYSLVIGEGYATPEEFLNASGEAVDVYVQANINTKAIQELYDMVKEIYGRIGVIENGE